MNHLNPKARFLQDKYAITYADFAVSEKFADAMATALLILELELPGTDNPSKAWDAHSQMVGARRLVDIILNLGEAPKPPQPRPDGLKY